MVKEKGDRSSFTKKWFFFLLFGLYISASKNKILGFSSLCQ